MKKLFLIGISIATICGCSTNELDQFSEQRINSIEEKIGLYDSKNLDFGERLIRIDSALNEFSSIQKRAFVSPLKDSIKLGRDFLAEVVIASFQKGKEPFAIVEHEQGIDTLRFNKTYESLVLKINSVTPGRHEFEGKIFEGDNYYPFAGVYYGIR